MKQPKLAKWHPYIFYCDHFSVPECRAIIQIAKGVKPEPARTGSADAVSTDPSMRKSEVAWLGENDQSRWVYDKLRAVIDDIRKNWYPFHLTGFEEPIQLTKYYGTENGHYQWHQDFGPGDMSTRKLSLVMLLSDPKKFEGGQLELMGIPGDTKLVPQLGRGTVIAFPSWEQHRVLPVTKGIRRSLVAWIHGPLFA